MRSDLLELPGVGLDEPLVLSACCLGPSRLSHFNSLKLSSLFLVAGYYDSLIPHSCLEQTFEAFHCKEETRLLVPRFC